MAQLFQPTNITPDMRGPFGNGVLIEPDVYLDYPTVDVSWQVNGNTAMTAFQIDFYKNDGSGDLITSTGKQTDNCPFYGMNQDGTVNMFKYTVELSDPSQSDFFDNTSGQIVITQWWSDDDSNYVVQASPSVYVVKHNVNPFVFYNGSDIYPSTTIAGRSATFTGLFEGQGDDAMLWVRWQLLDPDGNILKDTGKMYGSVELTFSYDGFIPGAYYYISLMGETEFGVKSTRTGHKFTVFYSQQDPGFHISASRACNGESAVQVTWPEISSIPLASSSGFYSMFFKELIVPYGETKGNISLSSGASLLWDVFFHRETTVVWRGSAESDGVYFTILFNEAYGHSQYVSVGYLNGHINLSGYVHPDGHFTYKNSENIPISSIGKMTFAVSQSSFLCICEAFENDGLYPSETLYPDSDLYPDSGSSIDGKYIIFSGTLDFKKQNCRIEKIELGTGECTVDYVKAVFGNITENTLLSDYVNGTPTTFDTGTRFLLAPNANQSYNAGSFPLIEDYLATFLKLYRRNVDNSTLVPVASIPIEKMSALDYGAKSQQGPYLYYLYVEGDDVFATVPAISNEVNPCFWNWALLSCTKNSDGSYVVQSSYLFGKNLASGAISNNNKPSVLGNFTRYPLVQMSQHNYKSGTLESLIGKIDSSDGQNKYYDTVDLKEEIYALSTTTNYLFLKNRKGDLWMVRPSADITMSTMDNTREQAQTVSFPWVEVGDATDAAIYQIPN